MRSDICRDKQASFVWDGGGCNDDDGDDKKGGAFCCWIGGNFLSLKELLFDPVYGGGGAAHLPADGSMMALFCLL